MTIKTITLSLAACAGFSLATVGQATDLRIQVISATCMSCHGPGGKSLGAIPSINGLERAYFVQSMKDFKSGARPGTIMKRHATGYTDAEFEAMAAYFATLK